MDFFLGPKKIVKPNGSEIYLYKGEYYAKQEWLPDEKLPFSKISVRKAHPYGNGWAIGGYNDLVEGDGSVYAAYGHEVATNGVRPSPDGRYNKANTIHISWIGGLTKRAGQLVYEDNRTEAQKAAIVQLVKGYLKRYPGILIAGHYQLNQKVCPLFDVPDFLRSIEVPEVNIYKADPWKIGQTLK